MVFSFGFIAKLALGDPRQLWLYLGVMIVALVLLERQYARRSGTMPPGARWFAAMLKILGVALLCLCLVELQWTEKRAAAHENIFLVVADHGRGLQVRERAGDETRAEQLAGLLSSREESADGGGWREALEDEFQVRQYRFGQRLRSVRVFDGDAAAFDEPVSDMGRALTVLRERFRGRPVAGVLLFSDGNATDLETAADLGDGFFDGAFPVYPVTIGAAPPERDLSIESVNVSQTVFEDAPVTIEADVSCHGYRGVPVELVLLNEAGEKIAAQAHEPGEANEKHRFRIRLKPEKTGVLFYTLAVAAKGEERSAGGETGVAAESAAPIEEATRENNRRIIAVDRGGGPYRVLYVSGRPNWEYKFLRRALIEDDQVDMTGLIRIARREPKFEWRGRSGESGNPLFRGFGRDDPEEETSYDKPVTIRLDTRDAAELADDFPGDPEGLFAQYEAIVIDDLEAAFFTADQQDLIEAFVSKRGGSLMMLGGQESFQLGGYEKTPIANLLPVYLDRLPAGGAPDGLKYKFTREGWLEPWLRLRPEEEDERIRLSAMPEFASVNEMAAIKPGASIFATVTPEEGREMPAIVGQRYGEGRVLAVTIGDLWRWGFTAERFRPDMEQTWRQIVRWLVADVPARFEFAAERLPGEAGRQIELGVRARDEAFAPLEDVVVSVEVREASLEHGKNEGADEATELPEPETETMDAEPAEDENGLYAGYVSAAREGAFRAVAEVRDENDELLGSAETGWVTDLAAEEFRRLEPNRELMGAIAERSGGRMVAPDELERLVRELPEREAPVMEVTTTPLWHQPWFFLAALACFIGEWGVRRRYGMA